MADSSKFKNYTYVDTDLQKDYTRATELLATCKKNINSTFPLSTDLSPFTSKNIYSYNNAFSDKFSNINKNCHIENEIIDVTISENSHKSECIDIDNNNLDLIQNISTGNNLELPFLGASKWPSNILDANIYRSITSDMPQSIDESLADSIEPFQFIDNSELLGTKTDNKDKVIDKHKSKNSIYLTEKINSNNSNYIYLNDLNDLSLTNFIYTNSQLDNPNCIQTIENQNYTDYNLNNNTKINHDTQNQYSLITDDIQETSNNKNQIHHSKLSSFNCNLLNQAKINSEDSIINLNSKISSPEYTDIGNVAQCDFKLKTINVNPNNSNNPKSEQKYTIPFQSKDNTCNPNFMHSPDIYFNSCAEECKDSNENIDICHIENDQFYSKSEYSFSSSDDEVSINDQNINKEAIDKLSIDKLTENKQISNVLTSGILNQQKNYIKELTIQDLYTRNDNVKTNIGMDYICTSGESCIALTDSNSEDMNFLQTTPIVESSNCINTQDLPTYNDLYDCTNEEYFKPLNSDKSKNKIKDKSLNLINYQDASKCFDEEMYVRVRSLDTGEVQTLTISQLDAINDQLKQKHVNKPTNIDVSSNIATDPYPLSSSEINANNLNNNSLNTLSENSLLKKSHFSYLKNKFSSSNLFETTTNNGIKSNTGWTKTVNMLKKSISSPLKTKINNINQDCYNNESIEVIRQNPSTYSYVQQIFSKVNVKSFSELSYLWCLCEIQLDQFEAIRCLSFSPDSKYFSIGIQTGHIYVWPICVYDPSGWRNSLLKQSPLVISVHTDAIMDIQWAVSQNTNYLISASLDKSVRIFEILDSTYVEVENLQCTDWPVAAIVHPIMKNVIYCGCLDSTIKVWTLEKEFKNKKIQNQHDSIKMPNIVTSISISPNGLILAVGLKSGSVAFLEATTLKFRSEVDCRNKRGKHACGRKVSSLVWSLDGLSLCVATSDSRIRIIDIKDLSTKVKFKGHFNNNIMLKALFSNDEGHVICGSENGNVYVWNVKDSFVPNNNPKFQFSKKKKCTNISYEYFKAFDGILTSCAVAPKSYTDFILSLIQFGSDGTISKDEKHSKLILPPRSNPSWMHENNVYTSKYMGFVTGSGDGKLKIFMNFGDTIKK